MMMRRRMLLLWGKLYGWRTVVNLPLLRWVQSSVIALHLYVQCLGIADLNGPSSLWGLPGTSIWPWWTGIDSLPSNDCKRDYIMWWTKLKWPAWNGQYFLLLPSLCQPLLLGEDSETEEVHVGLSWICSKKQEWSIWMSLVSEYVCRLKNIAESKHLSSIPRVILESVIPRTHLTVCYTKNNSRIFCIKSNLESSTPSVILESSTPRVILESSIPRVILESSVSWVILES